MQIEILNKETAPLGALQQRKEEILGLLKQNDGCTITNISRMLDIHPSTASKYLAVMEAERSVVCRQIGMAKVFRVVI